MPGTLCGPLNTTKPILPKSAGKDLSLGLSSWKEAVFCTDNHQPDQGLEGREISYQRTAIG